MDVWGATEAHRTERWGAAPSQGPHPSQSQVEEPVGCLPLEPSPGPDRRHWRQIFVLCLLDAPLLWLMTPCLNLKTDSAPQEKMDGRGTTGIAAALGSNSGTWLPCPWSLNHLSATTQLESVGLMQAMRR